jgi:hypothetical protein
MIPLGTLATGTLTINGTDVTYRSLSRRETITLSQMKDDQNAAEVFMVSKSFSISDEEAIAFLDSVDAPEADKILNAIAVLSGIRKGPKA